MRLNIVKKRYAPIPPYDCEIVEIDIQSVPYVLHGLWLKYQKYFWEQDLGNRRVARSMLSKQGASLLMPCGKDIVDAIDRIYRQNEVIHRGQEYTYTGDGTTEDPYIIRPAIPVVPTVAIGEEPGTGFFIAKTMRLVDNIVNGTTYADAPDNRNFRQQLDDIKQAIIDSTTDNSDLLSQLEIIAALLA